MLTEIDPKLPMRDKALTRDFYLNKLGFNEFGSADYDGYLMVQKDNIQIHFLNLQHLIRKKIMDRYISAPITLRSYISLLKPRRSTVPNWKLNPGNN